MSLRLSATGQLSIVAFFGALLTGQFGTAFLILFVNLWPLGAFIAGVTSYMIDGNPRMAVFHGILSWAYVFYKLIGAIAC